MSQLWVSAGIKVVAGKDIGQARAALNALGVITRQEPGNIQFEVLQQIDKPECFTLWECWNNEEALQLHYAAAHTQAYFAQEWTELVYIERLQHSGTDNDDETLAENSTENEGAIT